MLSFFLENTRYCVKYKLNGLLWNRKRRRWEGGVEQHREEVFKSKFITRDGGLDLHGCGEERERILVFCYSVCEALS